MKYLPLKAKLLQKPLMDIIKIEIYYDSETNLSLFSSHERQ